MSIPIGHAVLGRTETADLDERVRACCGGGGRRALLYNAGLPPHEPHPCLSSRHICRFPGSLSNAPLRPCFHSPLLPPQPEALAGVDLTTAAGVRDFLALNLGSHHAARRLLRAAEALLAGRRLFGARGGLMEGFAAKCAGSEGDGEEPAEVRVLCESLEGICWDWAELECTCPAARQSGACAHTAALLLATLDAADWSAAERPDPSAAEARA